MPPEMLPRMSEATIRKLATSQSFERGEISYQNGAILNPTIQGWELRADCQDSELYQPRVTLDENGITASSCTCFYDKDGICKHRVALLLTYIRQPQAFHVVPPLTEMLASRNREDLVTLVEHMVQRYPDLLPLVELSATQQSGQPMDISVYRRQAQQALHSHDIEEIAEDLQVLLDVANQLHQEGDWLDAGALYQMLLEETTQNYNEHLWAIDDDGAVAKLSRDFAAGLGQCLAKAQELDSATRQVWLTTLLAGVLKDLELGGIDFAAGANNHLLESVTESEWEWIEERIWEEIGHRDRWRRDALVSLLAERLDLTGRSEEGHALVHQLGSPEQRAFLLVQEGKLEEAITLAHKHFTHLPELMLQFADALLAANANEQAAQLIAEQIQSSLPYRGYQEWLAKYHRKYSDLQTALDWQQQVFLSAPSLENYKILRDLAQKAGLWKQLQVIVLDSLERKNQLYVMIEIALYEENIGRTLELLPRLDTWSQPSYTQIVAKAAEKTHPQVAIALYQNLVEQFISQRHTSSYQAAIQNLQRVKVLYESLKAQPEWAVYIQWLRYQYSTLRVLQNELDRAKL